MPESHVMVIGSKESFIIRVLLKKVRDAGVACEFVTWDVNDINAKWEGTSLVALFMDGGALPPEASLHFLSDKMSDGGCRIIPVGDKNDIQYITERFPKELVYRSFTRPVNNEEFVNTVTELAVKYDSGEFRKTILIVDDDPGYLGLVREWLKGTYKVALANSGLQAIKWLGKNKADLILLDHEMPVTSGPQVLEMLRSDEETRSIPVMFLTGKSDKKSVMAVVALKPEGYILKNVQKQDLLAALEKFFMTNK